MADIIKADRSIYVKEVSVEREFINAVKENKKRMKRFIQLQNKQDQAKRQKTKFGYASTMYYSGFAGLLNSISQFQTVCVEILKGTFFTDADAKSLLGRTGIDGKWGPKTMATMQSVQKAFRLNVTDLPNAALIKQMNLLTTMNPPPDLLQLLDDIEIQVMGKTPVTAPVVASEPVQPILPPVTQAGFGVDWTKAGIGILAFAGILYGLTKYEKKLKK